MSSFVIPYIPQGMNWIVGLLSRWEALHRIIFRIAALSGEVWISYALEVILLFPVSVPNYFCGCRRRILLIRVFFRYLKLFL